MPTRILRPFVCTGALLFLASCASTTPPPESTESAATTAESAGNAEAKADAQREAVTATETAAAERRSAPGGRDGGSSPAEMSKLVGQLNDAARELATLRTANAKLRAERERPRAAVEPVTKPDAADERLAASLKSYATFKQEMTNLLSEVDRLKRANAEMSADLKAASEQARQAKAAVSKVEDDARVEKRLRLEAEANAAQLRDQLRTIARAMSEAGLSSDKLSAQAESGGRGRTSARTPAKYVVREGDTLLKIAERMYGDQDKWRVIMDANRGKVGADGALEIGMELQIPRN